MLNIYAASFMTATRTPEVRLREMPPSKGVKRRRWFSRRPTLDIDMEKL